ncbi:hypothetical protein HPB50_002268 [Hyalomma asiaticum]|uniref:Uncharacterized protein n=1 Tax=Hyalomma asiaticum TaxID=266040 RepID=A0ACB7TD77_HYAAI|nr:hypothetical protein HPB50_002268 [Hyalomma asiaticum]
MAPLLVSRYAPGISRGALHTVRRRTRGRRDVRRSRPRIRQEPLERSPLVTLFAHPFPARETTGPATDGGAAAACSNIGPAGGATYRVPDPPRGALGTRRELRGLPAELLAGRSLPQTGSRETLTAWRKMRDSDTTLRMKKGTLYWQAASLNALT